MSATPRLVVGSQQTLLSSEASPADVGSLSVFLLGSSEGHLATHVLLYHLQECSRERAPGHSLHICS